MSVGRKITCCVLLGLLVVATGYPFGTNAYTFASNQEEGECGWCYNDTYEGVQVHVVLQGDPGEGDWDNPHGELGIGICGGSFFKQWHESCEIETMDSDDLVAMINEYIDNPALLIDMFNGKARINKSRQTVQLVGCGEDPPVLYSFTITK